MPLWIEKLILRLIGSRFTGSVELHFSNGVVKKVHEHKYYSSPDIVTMAPSNND